MALVNEQVMRDGQILKYRIDFEINELAAGKRDDELAIIHGATNDLLPTAARRAPFVDAAISSNVANSIAVYLIVRIKQVLYTYEGVRLRRSSEVAKTSSLKVNVLYLHKRIVAHLSASESRSGAEETRVHHFFNCFPDAQNQSGVWERNNDECVVLIYDTMNSI